MVKYVLRDLLTLHTFMWAFRGPLYAIIFFIVVVFFSFFLSCFWRVD